RRRNEWASPDEMFERFKDRSPFNRWQPAVLRDYCDYALLPNPYGSGYILACSPRFEESIYLNGFEPDLYDQIPAVTARTRVLRSGRQDAAFAVDMSISPTAPDLAAQFRHGEDVLLRDFSHFIPMEAPELVAGHIRAMRGD
ncbi:MAG TPA: hypothetical protein VMT34_01240, partial [Aggregatilineales bacterium]|nr:hypothetical protein [Aggregatilineales bacterium]